MIGRPKALLLASSLLLLPLLAGCDEKKPEGAATKPTAAAAPTPAPTPAPTMAAAAPTATATAAPPPKKEVVCSKDAAVTITNPDLEAQVRFQAQKPTGTLTKSDLAKIKTLKLTEVKGMDEIDPCLFPEFKALKGLYLPPSKISDITPLKSLSNLESLRLAATLVKDLTPLSSLGKLDRLDIGRTPVSDLSPIAGCVNLTELQIDETEVTDLSPLSKLTKLEMLQMKRTRITDLSPLRGHKSLKTLFVAESPVNDTALGIPGLKVHHE
jgi:internalin A